MDSGLAPVGAPRNDDLIFDGSITLRCDAMKTRRPAQADHRVASSSQSERCRHCAGSLSSIPFTYQFMLRTWPMSR
jgi:hypothetical protein